MRVYTRKFNIVKAALVTILACLVSLINPFAWLGVGCIVVGLADSSIHVTVAGICITVFTSVLFIFVIPLNELTSRKHQCSLFTADILPEWKKCTKKSYTIDIVKANNITKDTE